LRAYRRGLARTRQERAARRKLRQSHKPTLTGLLKQAAKAGKSVKGAEIYLDRVVLQFGEPLANDINPWDEVLIDAADQKRPS
jgi:hypothetical protein